LITLHKKIILDENGNPAEVVIPYEDFLELEEILGLDLEKEVVEQLKQAQRDRETLKDEAYVDLSEI
jgi:hypothetical protein